MGLKTKSILGIVITIDNKDKILKEVEKGLKISTKDQRPKTKDQNNPLIIFTPNPEIITYAKKDDNFRRIVNSAQINIPDGSGISWAMKKIYGLEIPRISGVDFMLDLSRLAKDMSLTVGLIGGRGAVAVETGECLRKKFPRLVVEVLEEPDLEFVLSIKYQVLSIKRTQTQNIPNTKYLIPNTEEILDKNTEEYFSSLAAEINKKNIDILFVALGCPKQELFINQLKDQRPKTNDQRPLILMSVGGAFDYIAGRVPRAPEWMRKRGWEWLFRLIRQPRRLGRQLKGAEFFWKVMTV